jgi:hypothetical protein
MIDLEFKDYPDTSTPQNATNLNEMQDNIEEAINNNKTALQTGWIPVTETWAFASVDDPTGVIYATGDVTTKYSAGMRGKMTNGGNVIFFIITAVSTYDSVNNRTTITFLHEIDPTDSLALHLMTDSAITANYYSIAKAPYGFPLSASKWTVEAKITSNYYVANPSSAVYYGSAVLGLRIPIGLWETSYQAGIQITVGVSQYCSCNLSTSNTVLENNQGFTDNQAIPIAGTILKQFKASKKIELTSPTTYYLMFKNDTAYTDLYITGSANSVSSIQALCAYL